MVINDKKQLIFMKALLPANALTAATVQQLSLLY